MGGGGDSTKTTATTTTNVATTTTAIGGDVGLANVGTVGDIGFTGANAVQFLTVLEQASLNREALRLDSLDRQVQQSGANFGQLIGGAGKLVQTGVSAARGGPGPFSNGEGQRGIFGGNAGQLFAVLGGAAVLVTLLNVRN